MPKTGKIIRNKYLKRKQILEYLDLRALILKVNPTVQRTVVKSIETSIINTIYAQI